MRVAYFDCVSGVSGDMLLGALVDAGVGLDALKERLRSLRLHEFELTVEKVTRGGIAGTKASVVVTHSHDHHRHLGDVLTIIESSDLPPKPKADAERVFRRLAEAEAKVHNTTPDKIHFHEVGAVDSIVDIVGAAIGLELLAVDQILVSPIRTGTGFVTCEHGRMPVPAPATAELLSDFPSIGTDIPHELATPTGVAILTVLGIAAPKRPAMAKYTIGYGAGGRDNPEMANVLRLFVGEAEGSAGEDDVWVVETNLDDLSPEIVAYACERVFEAGAVDVFTSPIYMKKGRQGVLLQAIAHDHTREAVEAAIFGETSTLGVRRYRAQRTTLARTEERVETQYGPVRVKVGRVGGEALTVAPEYDDCKAAAGAAGAPLKRVYEAALAAAREVTS